MLRTKFTYNPETLRYERAKISFLNILLSSISYLTFGVLFFAALLLIQNFLIETPLEKELKAENESLNKHKIVLAGLLTQSNQQLETLKKVDRDLYEKLFDTKSSQLENQTQSNREEILLSEEDNFNEYINELNFKFRDLYQSAKSSNSFFHAKASVKKEDVNTLFSIPSIIPIESFEATKLVSGFGNRINPFHKGHYHHDGIDIASPRGTSVIATGHGKVILTKRSELLAGYGNYVEIDHGHGIITRYSHLEDIVVYSGQKIKKGQSLGSIGSSGGSIAPHLHYEVIQDGVNVDPIKFFAEGLTAGQFQEIVTKSNKQNQSLD